MLYSLANLFDAAIVPVVEEVGRRGGRVPSQHSLEGRGQRGGYKQLMGLVITADQSSFSGCQLKAFY